MHRVLMLILFCALMQPIALEAQDADNKIKGINQRLFKFRQEFLELKEQIDKQQSLQKNQQEQFDLRRAEFEKQNQALVNQVENLQKEVQRLEQQLELNAATQLASDMNDLRKLVQMMILQNLNQTETLDDSLMEILNSPHPVISRDLMILFVAELMKNNEEWEQSLGYYGLLLGEFPESPYSPKAIYEMSEIFGQLDQKEEQKTLLLQLSYIEEKLESLESLSEEPPLPEEISPSETSPSETLSEEPAPPEEIPSSETNSSPQAETKPALPEEIPSSETNSSPQAETKPALPEEIPSSETNSSPQAETKPAPANSEEITSPVEPEEN